MTKTRLEAFSDGVIAIIITIMVLEFKIPHSASWSELEKIWPQLVSYIFSFVALGIYWGNHHHLLHTIKNVSSAIMWANLHLLFWLSLVPFATAWMGENEFARNTVITYTMLANICGFAYYLLLIAIKKCNQHNEVLLRVLHKQTRKGFLSNILYLLAFIAAFFHAAISGVLIVLVAIMWFLPDKGIEEALKEN